MAPGRTWRTQNAGAASAPAAPSATTHASFHAPPRHPDGPHHEREHGREPRGHDDDHPARDDEGRGGPRFDRACDVILERRQRERDEGGEEGGSA